PNLRPHIWTDPTEAAPLLRETLAVTDLVKISDDELAAVVGTSEVEGGARALRELGVGLAIVTLGERGCYYDGAAAGAGWVGGRRVDVVDASGAAAGFVAGLLAELLPRFRAGARPAGLDRASVEAGCGLANRVAAQVVTRFGATAALPRAADLA